MRSSTAVGLLLVSSASIFGIYGRQHRNPSLPPGPEPVYVNGVMGVYNPDTRAFVPSTSPLFDQTCDLIQRRREQVGGGSNGSSGSRYVGGSHHWTYFPSVNSYSYASGGASGSSSGFWGGSSNGGESSASSSRGGFGSTGHAFGGHGSGA